MNLRVKLKKLLKPKQTPKYDFKKLDNDEVRVKYVQAFKKATSKASKCIHEMEIEETYEMFTKAINEAAEKEIPKKQRTEKEHWMTEEILSKIRERRNEKNKDAEKYRKLDRDIKLLCLQAKERWLNAKCDMLERQLNSGVSSDFYKNIDEITFRKTYEKSGCIRAKDGTILMEQQDILNRWVEYLRDLFEDERGDKPTVDNLESGNEISREEIRKELARLKSGKATGPDNISIEMVKALDEIGIEFMHYILNKIYNTGHIPSKLKQSIFIAIPKVKGTADCDKHRTISLMSHVIKLFLRIVINRIRKKLREEISKLQYGFMKDRGTRNAIFLLRALGDLTINQGKQLHLCFIDYKKAFDRVRHDSLLDILQGINIDGKNLRIVINLYWEQEAAMRVNGEISDFVLIMRGVRQGCVMSPDLFNLYSEFILRAIQDIEGITINGVNINNSRYADDTVLIADSSEKLQRLIDAVVIESKRMGLELNTKKTEYLVVSRNGVPLGFPISANGDRIREVSQFNYLGSLVTCNGKCEKEVKRRVEIARDAFIKLRPVLCNRKLSMATRKRVLKCYVLPVVCYGCEAWAMNKAIINKLEAFEMWCLRRMLRISWRDHVPNLDVLRKSSSERTLISNIRMRQISFIGHVTRKNEMEPHILFAPRLHQRGRPRINFLNYLKNITGIAVERLRDSFLDRELVKTMVRQSFK